MHESSLSTRLSVYNYIYDLLQPEMRGILRILILFVLLMQLGGLSATNSTWTGNVSHAWSDAGNWDNGIPGLLDTASILDVSDSVYVNTIVDIKHLIIEKAALEVAVPAKLRIRSSDKIGFTCVDARVYNYGLIRVNSPDSIGLHLRGNSTYRNFTGSRIIVDHSGQESIRIEEHAILQNFSNSLVQSDTCIGALHNSGTLLNEGLLNLIYSLNGATGNIANLENDGRLINYGFVEIDSSASRGILNTDTLVNHGIMNIHNCGAEGILNAGFLENNDSIIIQSSNFGIIATNGGNYKNLNYTSVNLSKSIGVIVDLDTQLENEGELIISDIGNHGISNLGKITNNNLISINLWATALMDDSGIINSDTIVNGLQGEIRLNGQGVGDYGIYNLLTVDTPLVQNFGIIKIQETTKSGIFNQGLISNYNLTQVCDLTVPGSGITNSGTILNMDSIIIEDVPSLGISNGGKLEFLTGSVTSISNCGGNGLTMLSDGCLSNLGELSIKNAGNIGILNIGLIENSNTLIISTVENGGIFTTGSFINTESGNIWITDVITSDPGIKNGSSGANEALFFNAGAISIFDVGSYGVLNEALVTNTGKMLIDSTQDIGLYNSRIFENQDTLLITRYNTYGVYNTDTLTNFSEGYIGVLDILNGDYGIFNESGSYLSNDGEVIIVNSNRAGLLNVGELINNQSIMIDSIETYGIWNLQGIMTNSMNATILVNNVTDDGVLFKNDFNASFVCDGHLLLSKLNLDNSENAVGISCGSGTSFYITEHGDAVISEIGTMSDFLLVEEDAIFLIDGVIDFQY